VGSGDRHRKEAALSAAASVGILSVPALRAFRFQR
jgi:hypothetical protein